MAGLLFPSDYINGTNPLWWGMDYLRRKRDGHIVLAACPNQINNPPIVDVAHPANTAPWTTYSDGRMWVSVWDDNTPSNAGAPQELEPNGCANPSIGERSDGTLDLFYAKNGDAIHRYSRDGGLTWSIGAIITPAHLSNINSPPGAANNRIAHCYYGKSGLLILIIQGTSVAPLVPAFTNTHWLVVGQINSTTQRWVLTDPPLYLDSDVSGPSLQIERLQSTKDGKVYMHRGPFKFDSISANGSASWVRTNPVVNGRVLWGGTFRGVAAGGGIDDGNNNNRPWVAWIDEPSGLLIKIAQTQNDGVASRDGWHTYLKGADGIWEEQASGPPFASAGFGGPQGTMDKWRLHWVDGSGFDRYSLNLFGVIKSRPDGRWEWMFPFPTSGEINFKLTRNMQKGQGTIWS